MSGASPTVPLRRSEIIVLSVLLGAVPAIGFFLAAWWISIPLVPESRVFIVAFGGLVAGTTLDVFVLKRWVQRFYSMRPVAWMAVYLFYSVGMFGFFMGVPVFNVLLGVPAGFFIAGWLVRKRADVPAIKKAARHCASFTTAVLALICMASAFFALVSPSTPSDVRGLLRLPFQVTTSMVVGLIAVGGATILVLEWWLTVKAVERSYRFLR